MNVEKLNTIISLLLEDYKNNQVVQLMTNVSNTLQNVIQQPQQPQHQTNLGNQLKALYSGLQKSKVNDFSPAFNNVLIELNIEDLFGNRLESLVQEVFSRNTITPAVAKQDLDKLLARVNELNTGLTNTSTGLGALKIQKDTLAEGECEIGVLIPRKYIDNELGQLADEIKELNFIFNNYAELITGKKQSFKLRHLSTSDPLITIGTITAIAAGVAKTIGWLIDNYKKLLEIKKLRAELKKQGLSDETLQGITDHSNSFMENAINDIVIKIGAEYNSLEEGRKNELLNGVRISLNKIANRIDQGFNFEVRIEMPAKKAEGKETEKESKEITAIKTASESLQFIKLDGEPILSLPENGENKDSGTKTKPKK